MSDDDNTVGYKKPPQQTRFKSGQSGNPKGRPKGYKNIKTDLLEELKERVSVTENGKTKKMSKQRILLKRLCSKSLGGDANSTRLLVSFIQRYLDSEPENAHTSVEVLSADDEDILAHYVQQKMHE